MNWTTRLRTELSKRAARYAEQNDLPFYTSPGSTVLFERFADGKRHGNFADPAFTEILARPDWRRRLTKPHSHRKSFPAPKSASAKELDSCNSSDALLMNACCYPGAERLAWLFSETEETWAPEFGVAGKVSLTNGRADDTEIDLRLGSTLCEAKLTEPDFTRRSVKHVSRYRDVDAVFDLAKLTENNYVGGYQLIRNVLAAHEHHKRFVVLCDARRPDLIQAWWLVHSAIREVELRLRCRLLLWQEVAAAAPKPLQVYLASKYGLKS